MISSNRIACGKILHVAISRCDLFDGAACVCSTDALQIWVPKERMWVVKKYKTDPNNTNNYQHGAKTVPK